MFTGVIVQVTSMVIFFISLSFRKNRRVSLCWLGEIMQILRTFILIRLVCFMGTVVGPKRQFYKCIAGYGSNQKGYQERWGFWDRLTESVRSEVFASPYINLLYIVNTHLFLRTVWSNNLSVLWLVPSIAKSWCLLVTKVGKRKFGFN